MASLTERFKKLKDALPQNTAFNQAKKAAAIASLGASAAFAAALLYFLNLAGAAFNGFMIGMGIGGTGGAVGGAIIGAEIGTIVIPIPIVGTLVGGAVGGGIGFLVGGTVGGVAGGLIALGFTTGSATAVATGIGTGVGGTIGAYAGYALGTAAGAGIVAVCAAVTGGTCVLLAPIIPISGAVGGMFGAFVGGAIGGATGYLIGRYALDTTISYIKGTPNAVGSAASGTLATFGHFLTGIASTFWGGIVGGSGWLLGKAIDLGGSIFGHLSSITGATAGHIAAVSVGVGVASAAGMAILSSGVLTPSSFFTPQIDQKENLYLPKGEEYVTVTKTADPTTLSNSDLPKTINFEVTLQTKTVKIINITCDDQTILTKSDGSTKPLAVNPAPVCPDSMDANTNLVFKFTTQADNTPEFQNSRIINTFNIHYDTESLATGSCGAGSNFVNLLPNPIPASAGAVSPSILSRLNAPSPVVPAAIYAAQKSGVACELMVGIDYVEASWNKDESFVDGGVISRFYPVQDASMCANYNGTWDSTNGCKITTLNDVAYYAANVVKDKMASKALGYGWRPPASFREMAGAMSLYNGGGNANCGTTPYTGTCPPPWIGDDDAYVMTHFDSSHQTMYIRYCDNGVLCPAPYANTRDGAATAAKVFYQAGAGPFP